MGRLRKNPLRFSKAHGRFAGSFRQDHLLAVIPIYLFYFLSSNRNFFNDLDQELAFLSDSLREDLVFLIREFVGILVAFFRGQLLIAAHRRGHYAIGFSLSGLKFGLRSVCSSVCLTWFLVGVSRGNRDHRLGCLSATIGHRRKRTMEDSHRLRSFLCRGSVVRKLLPYAQDHGRTNRIASRRGDGFDFLLGNSARGNSGNDLWHSPDRILHHRLNASLQEVFQSLPMLRSFSSKLSIS